MENNRVMKKAKRNDNRSNSEAKESTILHPKEVFHPPASRRGGGRSLFLVSAGIRGHHTN